MLRSAFSLIELLVVVAIIAIIAAIAIPIYANYSIRAKIAGLIPIMNQFANQTMLNYINTGTFISTNPSNPSSYSPYISSIYINNYPSCPNHTGEVSIIVNNTAVGYSGPANSLFFEILVVDRGGGSFTQHCYWRNDHGLTQAVANAYLPSNCQTQAPSNGCT